MTPARRLEQVLDQLAAEAPAVARGRLALAKALAWTGTTAWPEVGWTFSRLADGWPVELVWRAGTPGLYWTAEPAAPELAPAARLEQALALVAEVGGALDPDMQRLASRLAEAATTPFPVWIGGRHTAAGDAAKLYILIDYLPHEFRALAPLMRANDRPTMAGLSTSGERELYWTRPARAGGDLWRLRSDTAVAPLADRLDCALAEWTGSGFDDPRGSRLGLSVQLDAENRPLALAAFLRAGAAGGEKRTRDRLLECGGSANPALGRCWSEGLLRPLLISLVATGDRLGTAIGLTLPHGDGS